MPTSERFRDSKVLADIINTGRQWREVAKGLELQICPFCNHDNYHFFVALEGSMAGVYKCVRCGTSGGSKQLYEKLGLRVAGVESRSDWASDRKMEELPNIEEIHEALLSNEPALKYLTDVRGFSLDVIKRQQLGYVERRYFRELGGEFSAIVFPYIINGSCSFAHYRTIPPSPKSFSSPTGREATLYNFGVLREGLKEVTFVEGECDLLSLLDHGIENVVAVPGASFRKATWIDSLDKLNLEKIFILYDNDATGKKESQNLASRIGIDRCYKINLPNDFNDVNDWFLCEGTKEKFEELQRNAKQFDVQGAISSRDALTELEESLTGKDSLGSSYETPWPSLNRLVGLENGDICDIISPEKHGKTTYALNLVDYLVARYSEDAVFVCLEMSTTRLARKWVSHITQFDDSLPKTREEAIEKLTGLREAIPKAKAIAASRQGDLYFCYPIFKTIEEFYKLLHDCVRRYGCRIIVIDNVQLLADRTLTNQGHRTIHLSQISKNLSALAKDYGIKMIRLLQPHRLREGAICSTDNVDGASQLEKDCDCAIVLHRSKVSNITEREFEAAGFIEAESSFDERMLVRVGLSRYSSGGLITLQFDGARSTVREYDLSSLAKMHTEAQTKGTLSVESEAKPKALSIGGELL